MSLLKRKLKKKNLDYRKRASRVNAKLKASKPDFIVFVTKSNIYIKAQAIQSDGNVIADISDKGLKGKTKTERAEVAGEKMAKKLKEKKIKLVSISRGGNKYHGRIKSFVEGLRKGGIQC